jgi:hypothetical protein
MTDYPQYPTDPSASGGGTPGAVRGPRPASVDMAIKMIWANVALSLVSTVITFIMLDSIVDAALEDAGINTTVDTDAVRTGAVVGAVIGIIISVGIAALLIHFIGKGANWARIVYTVLGVLGILASLFGLGSQPAVLMLLSVISLAITAAAVFFLWKPESSAYFSAS